MSEEDIIDIAEKIANFGWSDYDDFVKNKKAIQGLLDLYNKEKRKNKVYTELLKQNENKAKIKTCMTHNLPDNAEIICMIREDFERNFGNDYVSKDKIREFKNKFIKDSKNEKVFMTQSSQINASLIQFCNELLEERK